MEKQEKNLEWPIVKILIILILLYFVTSILFSAFCVPTDYVCHAKEELVPRMIEIMYLFFIVRLIIAKVRHEKNRYWQIYLIILGLSHIWLRILISLLEKIVY